MNTRDLLSGEIAPIERYGYPEYLVNHKIKQARFNALFASLPTTTWELFVQAGIFLMFQLPSDGICNRGEECCLQSV